MFISIITINLNNYLGLKKTILSVINQKVSNVEYIVVDGGSTDGSIELIEGFSKQIDYWISEPDSGIYNAMNKGITKCHGQYCFFLNSGDTLIHSSLSKITDMEFKEDIIYGNIILTYKDGTKVKDKGAGQANLTFYNFFAGSSIRHQAAFIKVSLFRLHGLYDESYKIISDWAFFMNVVIFKQVSVKYINIDIAYFDPYGVGSTNLIQSVAESELELKKFIPQGILNDYYEMKRLKEQNEILENELKRYKHRFKLFDKFISQIKCML